MNQRLWLSHALSRGNGFAPTSTRAQKGPENAHPRHAEHRPPCSPGVNGLRGSALWSHGVRAQALHTAPGASSESQMPLPAGRLSFHLCLASGRCGFFTFKLPWSQSRAPCRRCAGHTGAPNITVGTTVGPEDHHQLAGHSTLACGEQSGALWCSVSCDWELCLWHFAKTDMNGHPVNTSS